MSKSAADIIIQLSDLIKGIWSQKENPDGLSKSLNDLAVLNWALAQYMADYEEQERAMKTALELERATLLDEYTTDGTAVNKAEIKVTIELAKMRAEYNKVASALEKTKIICRANDRVMDSARSRLSLIKQNVEGK